MADENPGGKKFAPERVEATTQALLLLHEQLFASPPARLQVSDLLAWHAVLAAPLGVRAGVWRAGEITFGSYYGFPPTAIDAAVRGTYARANEHLDSLSFWPEEDRLAGVVAVSAYVHARLIRIHPFEDGNGRVSRLVLTGQFLTAGFDPPDFSRLSRTAYVTALNKYNHLGTDDLFCAALEPLKLVIFDLL